MGMLFFDFLADVILVVFFFKQKTAYEMRISDWSSDVCSSDLDADGHVEVVIHDAILILRRIDDAHRRLDAQPRQVLDERQHDALEQRTAQQNFEAEDAPRLLVRQLQRVLVDLPARVPQDRSEEHTSELQSLMPISHAVFCLKKQTK